MNILKLLRILTSALTIVGCLSIGWSLELRAAEPRPTSPSPKRIVSTALACDELVVGILKQLAPTHASLSRIVAISQLADNETYTNLTGDERRSVQLRVSSDAEQVAALSPDLVLATVFNRPEFLHALKKTKIQTLTLGPFDSLKDILTAIEVLGIAIHEPAAAARLAHSMVTDLETIRHRIPLSVRNTPGTWPRLVAFSGDGTIAGENTPFDSIARAAGGQNEGALQKLKGFTKVSPEFIAQMAPDWIVVGGNPQNREQIIQRIQQSAGWSMLRATKNLQIMIIPENNLLATSHHIIKAVATINHTIHPTTDEQSASKQKIDRQSKKKKATQKSHRTTLEPPQRAP